MIEQQTRLGIIGMETKIIRHHQNDVNVIWMGCGGDMAAEDDQPCQFACSTGKLIDTLETGCDSLALRRHATKYGTSLDNAG